MTEFFMGKALCFSAIFTKGGNFHDLLITSLSPVVQSIVSLTSLLRGHLVKCITTL